MQPFTKEEIEEIERCTNSEFLQNTSFSIRDLRIPIKRDYFFRINDAPAGEDAYAPTMYLSGAGPEFELFESQVFTVKRPAKEIAFHIAHDIWRLHDKTFNSPLWKNFEPKG